MAERLTLTPGSHGQVAEFTGAHTRAGQIRNLVRNGVRHTINAAGWPVVMRSTVEGSEATPAAPKWKPNKAA